MTEIGKRKPFSDWNEDFIQDELKSLAVFVFSVCCGAVGSSESATNDGQSGEVCFAFTCAFTNLHQSCYLSHSAPWLSLQGSPTDHHYDDVQMQNQQPQSGHTLQSVYDTVNPNIVNTVSQLQYASISFQGDSGTVSDGNLLPDTNENGSAVCNYSYVRRT